MVKSVFFSQFSAANKLSQTKQRQNVTHAASKPLADAAKERNTAQPPMQKAPASLTLLPSTSSVEKHISLALSSTTPNLSAPVRGHQVLPLRLSHHLSGPSCTQHLPIKKRILFLEKKPVDAHATSHHASISNKQKKLLLIKQVLKKWLALTQAERNQITLSEFAKSHNISRSTLNNYVTQSGEIRPHGQYLLSNAGNEGYKKLTASHIRAWLNLNRGQQNTISAYEFTKQYRINFHTWRQYVTSTGTLRPQGQQMIDNAYYKKVTADDLSTWCNMSQIERDQITHHHFAIQRQINLHTWNHCISSKGILRPLGQRILNSAARTASHNKVNTHHIETWVNMSQQERNLVSMSKFAQQYKINLNSLKGCVSKQGTIRVTGQRILERESALRNSMNSKEPILQTPLSNPIAENKLTTENIKDS